MNFKKNYIFFLIIAKLVTQSAFYAAEIDSVSAETERLNQSATPKIGSNKKIKKSHKIAPELLFLGGTAVLCTVGGIVYFSQRSNTHGFKTSANLDGINPNLELLNRLIQKYKSGLNQILEDFPCLNFFKESKISPNPEFDDWYTKVKNAPLQLQSGDQLWNATDEELRFYRECENYGEFSNFYSKEQDSEFKFNIDGTEWASSETYFQFLKFQQEGNPILPTMAPMAALDAASTAQKIKPPTNMQATPVVVAGWFDQGIRVATMFYVLLHKFYQNPRLAKLLVGTGNKILVEYNTSQNQTDNFWSVKKFTAKTPYTEINQGRNCLGILLMIIRSVLMTPQAQ